VYGWNLGNVHGDGFEKMITEEDVARPHIYPYYGREEVDSDG
jgi:hypothetical protein